MHFVWILMRGLQLTKISDTIVKLFYLNMLVKILKEKTNKQINVYPRAPVWSLITSWLKIIREAEQSSSACWALGTQQQHNSKYEPNKALFLWHALKLTDMSQDHKIKQIDSQCSKFITHMGTSSSPFKFSMAPSLLAIC